VPSVGEPMAFGQHARGRAGPPPPRKWRIAQ